MKLFEVALQQPIKNRLLVIGKASDIAPLKKRMIFLTGRFEVVVVPRAYGQRHIEKEKQQMFNLMLQYYPNAKKSSTKFLYARAFSHTDQYKTLFKFIDAFEKLVNTFEKPDGEWTYSLGVVGVADKVENGNE